MTAVKIPYYVYMDFERDYHALEGSEHGRRERLGAAFLNKFGPQLGIKDDPQLRFVASDNRAIDLIRERYVEPINSRGGKQ